MRNSIAALLVVMATVGLAVAAPAVDTAQHYDGFLYSKLQAIGTRSEAPASFLQTVDDKDVPILKHASMWQNDPVLQAHLGTMVTVDGKMQGDVLFYTAVKPYEPKGPTP